jgi:hypothetical protein
VHTLFLDQWNNNYKKSILSEKASPSFTIPKKNGTIRVVTDFRKNSTQLIETSKSAISYSKN